MNNDTLIELAKIIQDGLKDIDGIDLPEVIDSGVVKVIESDSIYVVVGGFPGTDHEIQVWFDGDTGWDERKFWYGFGTYDQSTASMLARLGRDNHGDSGPLLKPGRGKRPTNRDGFGQPVLEGRLKPDREFWYGVYLDQTPKVGTNEIEKASEFVADLTRLFLEYQAEAAANAEASNAGLVEAEERKRMVSHVKWERNSKAAQTVKEKAGFECAVCREKMGTKYGDDIGRDYAEAHHKIPLAELEGRTAKITSEDLVCVCANCHRMLHRLIAKKDLDGPDALAELQRRVKG